MASVSIGGGSSTWRSSRSGGGMRARGDVSATSSHSSFAARVLALASNGLRRTQYDVMDKASVGWAVVVLLWFFQGAQLLAMTIPPAFNMPMLSSPLYVTLYTILYRIAPLVPPPGAPGEAAFSHYGPFTLLVGSWSVAVVWLLITILGALVHAKDASHRTHHIVVWRNRILHDVALGVSQCLAPSIMANLLSVFYCSGSPYWEFDVTMQCSSSQYITWVALSACVLPGFLALSMLHAGTGVTRFNGVDKRTGLPVLGEPFSFKQSGSTDALASSHGRVEMAVVILRFALACVYTFGAEGLPAYAYVVCTGVLCLLWIALVIYYLPYHMMVINQLACAVPAVALAGVLNTVVAQLLMDGQHDVDGAFAVFVLCAVLCGTLVACAVHLRAVRVMQTPPSAASPYAVDLYTRCALMYAASPTPLLSAGMLGVHRERASPSGGEARYAALGDVELSITEAGGMQDGVIGLEDILDRETSHGLGGAATAQLWRQLDSMYREAATRLAGSAIFHVLYAQYVGRYRGNHHLERVHLRHAAALADSLAFDVRYFVWQRLEEMAREEDERGSSNMTLAKRVQFEALLQVSRHQMRACRGLLVSWWTCLCDRVPDMTRLETTGRRITAMTDATATCFEELLQLAPQSTLVMRSYAAFLMDILNDPGQAHELLAAAEQVEDEQSRIHAAAAVSDVAVLGALPETDLSSESLGMLELSLHPDNLGAVLTANAAALRVLGYSKRELAAKDLAALLPEPLDSFLTTGLREFALGGKQRTLGTGPRCMLVRHRAGHLVAVRMDMRPADDAFWLALEELATPYGFLVMLGASAGWRVTGACKRTLLALGVEASTLTRGFRLHDVLASGAEAVIASVGSPDGAQCEMGGNAGEAPVAVNALVQALPPTPTVPEAFVLRWRSADAKSTMYAAAPPAGVQTIDDSGKRVGEPPSAVTVLSHSTHVQLPTQSGRLPGAPESSSARHRRPPTPHGHELAKFQSSDEANSQADTDGASSMEAGIHSSEATRIGSSTSAVEAAPLLDDDDDTSTRGGPRQTASGSSDPEPAPSAHAAPPDRATRVSLPGPGGPPRTVAWAVPAPTIVVADATVHPGRASGSVAHSAGSGSRGFGRGGDGDNKSVGSGGGGSTTSLRATLRRHYGTERSLLLLRRAVLATFIVLAAVLLASAITLSNLVAQLSMNMRSVVDAGDRAIMVSRLVSATQLLMYMPVAIYPTSDAPRLLAIMGDTVERFRALSTSLYSNPSILSPAERILYEQPVTNVSEPVWSQFTNAFGTYQSTVRGMGLVAMAAEYETHARRVMLIPVGTHVNTMPDNWWTFLIGGSTVLTTMNTSMLLADARSASQMDGVGISITSLMGVAIGVLVVMGLSVIIPAVLGVLRERQHVFELYMDVPAPVARALRARAVKQKAESEAADDDEASGETVGDRPAEINALDNGVDEEHGDRQLSDDDGDGLDAVLAAMRSESASGGAAGAAAPMSPTAGGRKRRVFRRAQSTHTRLLGLMLLPVLVYVGYFVGVYFYHMDNVTFARYARTEMLWTKQLELNTVQISVNIRYALARCIPGFTDNQAVVTNRWAALVESLQDSLLYGNPTLGVRSALQTSPATADLYLRDGCVENNGYYYNVSDCRTTFYNGLVGRGLLPAFKDFVSLSRNLGAERTAAVANMTTCRPAPLTVGNAGLLHNLAEKYLTPGFTRASQIRQQEATDRLSRFVSVNATLTFAGLLFLFVFYFGLYLPTVRVLDRDIKHARRLLLLLPEQVARAVPSVRALMEKLSAVETRASSNEAISHSKLGLSA